MVFILQIIVLAVLLASVAFALVAMWQTWEDGERSRPAPRRRVPPPAPKSAPPPEPEAIPPEAPAETPPAETRREKITRVKGQIGEKLIEIKILQELNPRRYRAFHNLLIPCGNGSTQIDHVIVSPYGIFVIEVKYFAGWIYGGERQPRWTQTLSPRHKYPFQNPLRQNYKHIKALSALLCLPEAHFHSVAVFAHRDCRLKTVMPANVCLLNGFIPYIQSFEKPVLNVPQLQAACAVLGGDACRADEERLQQHIKSLSVH